jgi:thymidylate synthase (FAD)
MTLDSKQTQEIEILREHAQFTRRATAPALEETLYQPVPVLDHGFVRVVDYMGNDDAIVQAARVSYGAGTKRLSDDRGLINYLMRMRHTSPFEMCEIKLHCKMPLFVARQWIRHRTASVNEYSGRYSEMDSDFYVPENFKGQDPTNRQGSGDNVEDRVNQKMWIETSNASKAMWVFYQDLLKQGASRELARMVLPVNFYTQWYWKIDLHNLLHFLSLRVDPHAQYEIRVYADAILDIVKQWVPLTHAAFLDYRLEGASLSAKGLEVVRRRLRGETVDKGGTGMNPREWSELQELLDPQKA